MNLFAGNGKWIALGVILLLATFGGLCFLIGFYAIIFFGGFLMLAYFYGEQRCENIALLSLSTLILSPSGVPKISGNMNSVTKIKNFDKRMTGASVIDDVLKEVLEYTVRDYIKTWYRTVSDHDAFHVNIWQCAQKVVISFAHRTKEIDWMPYFTQRLVDDFASHIRLYRRALDKKKQLPPDEFQTSNIEELFFDLEVDMEDNLCRDLICLDSQAERQYLQDLSDVLLFLLLPKEDFHNKPFRFIMREVLVNGVFIPTVDLLSDPDYINQYIAWLCESCSFTKESFLSVIKCSDNMEELEAIKLKVENDITKWRSKDSGGDDDTLVKQNLNSLRFVQDNCIGRIKRLQDGPIDNELPEEPEFLKYHNLYILNLDDIINNNIALQSFIEFMTNKGGQQILFFYLNVEGFRTAAEQQISEAYLLKQTSNQFIEPDLQSLRRAAMIIYDQYLSEKATIRIKLPPDLVKRTLQNIKNRMLSEDVFDAIQARVYQMLHTQYYEEYLQSNDYVKLLSELGMLTDGKNEDGDNISIDDEVYNQTSSADDMIDNPMDQSPDTMSLDSVSSASSSGTQSGEAYVIAQITQTGIVKEPEKSGKSYAIFAITVRRKTADSDEESVADIYRRYSDFHDLHMLITEACPILKGPHFPGKTVLKNMNKEFLEKRRKGLDHYLRGLSKAELWLRYPIIEELVAQFLAPGLWEKHKSQIARKMDTIVNPLRTSVKTVGSAVKSVPDGITDGFGKMFKGSNSDLSNSTIIDEGKVGKGLNPDDEENIPVRIMLLLMDEVFDLRHKNQSLRRMIVTILRQLISATYGDTINRKIVDHVDLMTSAEQMSEYLKAFRDSFWPNGILAEPRFTRDINSKMRTRVFCKAKMLGSIPDELKTLLGSDVVKMGVSRIFEMFQHKNLNKRILYVCLEGVLQTMFSSNKFAELFRKLHSQSTRIQKVQAEKKGVAQDSGVRRRQTKQ